MEANGPSAPWAGLLQGVPLFSGLDRDAVRALEKLVEVRDVEGGAMMAVRGESADSLFVLVSGKVKVVLDSEDGREVILSIFRSPGDFFGEMSLLDDAPRSASLVAMEPSRLLLLSRGDFRRHLDASPRTAQRVLTEVARRLRRADELIGDLALLDVFARLAAKLRELAVAEGEEVEGGLLVRARPTQAELAAMIGSTRETVSRVLSELSRRGHLEAAGKSLLVRKSFFVEVQGRRSGVFGPEAG